MTLTVLSDEQVQSILETLTIDDLDEFRQVLSSALHEFSTNTQAAPDGPYQQPHRVSTFHPTSKVNSLYMPSCGPEGMGCKVISQTTAAAARETEVKTTSPTGTVSLFSPDGKPIGILNARTLTAFRTALASSCLLLRRNHVRTITVFGAGLQAYWHIRLALMMRGHTIRHIHIINRSLSETSRETFKRFTTVPAEIKAREGWTDAQFSILTPSFNEYDRLHKEYIRSADVIYCCTPSRSDLFDGRILTSREGRKKGRLIVAVGSFTPDMRELPEELLLQATKQHEKPHRHFHKHAEEGSVIVVDTLDGVLKEAGEVIAAKIDANHLVELGELVMLHRMAIQEASDTDTMYSQTSTATSESEKLDLDDKAPAMSSVFGSGGDAKPWSRPSSPTGSTTSGSHGHGVSFKLPFRSNSTSSTDRKKKKEDSLARWLRDGTVIYKSVGLGLMDLVVGMHLVGVAEANGVGTRVEGF